MRQLMIILLTVMFSNTLSAQDIYKEVKLLKQRSEALMNDTTKSMETRLVACFKNDALYYLISKAGDDSTFTEYELGQQANAMIEYVNLYVKKLSEQKKKKDRETVKNRFKYASMQNSLFNDMDKDLVYGYVNNDRYITQFSLDTNWVKALAAVRR